MGRTRKKPRTIGSDVPNARRRRKDEVLPAYAMCDNVENRKAERPNPDNTTPVADPRYQGGVKSDKAMVG